ncbi:hypothetical protein ACJJTC_015950 [Scirpophaga incertulas]
MSVNFGNELAREPTTLINSTHTEPNTNYVTENPVVAESAPIYNLVSNDKELRDQSTNFIELSKTVSMSAIVEESLSDEDFVDDIIKIDFNMEANTQFPNSKTNKVTITETLLIPKNANDTKIYNNIFKLKMDKADLSKIDFQKNSGLVGLKIIPLDRRNNTNSSKCSTSKNSNMTDNSIFEINNAQNSVETIIIPYPINSDPKKLANEKLPLKTDVLSGTENTDKGAKIKINEKNDMNQKAVEIMSQKNKMVKPTTEQSNNTTAISTDQKHGDVKDKRKTNKYLNDLIKKKNKTIDVIKKLKKIRDACNVIKNSNIWSINSVINQALCEDIIEDLSKSVEARKSPILPCNVTVLNKPTQNVDIDNSENKKHRHSYIQIIDNMGKELSNDKRKETQDVIDVSGEDDSGFKITVNEAGTYASLLNKKCNEQILITTSHTQPNSDSATNIVISTRQNSTKDQNSVPDHSVSKTPITCGVRPNKTSEISKKEFAYVPPNQHLRQNMSINIPVVRPSYTRNVPDIPIYSAGGKSIKASIPHYHATTLSNQNANSHIFVSAQNNYNPGYEHNIIKTMPLLTDINEYSNNVYPHWNQYLVTPPPPPPQQYQTFIPNEQSSIPVPKNKTAPVLIPCNINSMVDNAIQHTIYHDNYNSYENFLGPNDKNATNNRLNAEFSVAHATGPLADNNSTFYSSSESNIIPVNKNNIQDLASILYKRDNNIPPKKRFYGLFKDVSVKAASKIKPCSTYNTYNCQQHESVASLTTTENSTGINLNAGYSAPALPTPSYQSSQDIMSGVNYEYQKDPRKEYVRAKLVQIPVETDVNNMYRTNERSARKIPVQKYTHPTAISHSFSIRDSVIPGSPRMKRARTDNRRAKPHFPSYEL